MQLKPLDCLKLNTTAAAQGVQLSSFKQQPKGEEIVIAFISKGLQQLTSLLPYNGSADALVLWAEMIAIKYWHFKAEEIYKAFMEGAAGSYGKIYGALNYQNICSWLDAYEEIKLKAAQAKAGLNKETFDSDRQSEKSNKDALTIKDLKDLSKLKPYTK